MTVVPHLLRNNIPHITVIAATVSVTMTATTALTGTSLLSVHNDKKI